MNRHRSRTTALRVDRQAPLQVFGLAALLVLALLLGWHGWARAQGFTPSDTAQLPDAMQGPGADRIPPALACSDNMDFTPEENQSSPFDADTVAWRAARNKAHLSLVEDSCQHFIQLPDAT